MKWYKNNQNVQNCLLKFELINILMKKVHTSSRNTLMAEYQNCAIKLLESISRDPVVASKLSNNNLIFDDLYTALNNTLYVLPVTFTNMVNINSAVDILLHVFGSQNTVKKASNMKYDPASISHQLSKLMSHTVA